MNCRDSERLLSAERDGALTDEQHAVLDQHVAACPACQRTRREIADAMEVFRSDAINAAAPDADEAWRLLRAELVNQPSRNRSKTKLAPIIWIGGSLAASAAVAFAFVGSRPSAKQTAAPTALAPEVAQAEYVEPGDAKASTMVYVDKDSGWLVVWATEVDATTKG